MDDEKHTFAIIMPYLFKRWTALFNIHTTVAIKLAFFSERLVWSFSFEPSL